LKKDPLIRLDVDINKRKQKKTNTPVPRQIERKTPTGRYQNFKAWMQELSQRLVPDFEPRQ
jgi:hypothetical protein